jgi:hypothetical protein
VDQIVTDQLTNIESEFYDNKLLLKIYQTLWDCILLDAVTRLETIYLIAVMLGLD